MYWACFAMVCLGAVELAAASGAGDRLAAHLRFLAACTTFCPLMAVLGARRPQHRGWQWVVVSLLGVLAFYGLTEMAVWPGPPAPPDIVRWLLIAPLIAMGLLNHLPTRFWASAVLVAVGQVALFAPIFPQLAWLVVRALDWLPTAGVGLLSLAACLAALGIPRSTAAANDTTSYDRLWLDYRDAFGSFWAMRILVRFNDTAGRCNWPVTLTWQGFLDPHGGSIARLDPTTDAALQQALASLLRRFVDHEWMEARRFER